MKDIKALIDRCLQDAESLGLDNLAGMAKKAALELARIKRTNYAFRVDVKVTINEDGKPVVSEDDEEEAMSEYLFLICEQDWMEEYAEPVYSEFILNITETEQFQNIKKAGVYRFFQAGLMTAETSTDWESGHEELDGFIYEPVVTHVENKHIDIEQEEQDHGLDAF